MKKQGRAESATWLVYWYGTTKPNEYYSLLPSKSIIPYEKAKSKGMHQLPKAIKKKFDGNKKLSKLESDVVRGYQEMEEDLLKEPSQRRRGVMEWTEQYEMLTVKDVEQLKIADKEVLEDADDELEEYPESAESKKIAAAGVVEGLMPPEAAQKPIHTDNVAQDVGSIGEIGEHESEEEDEKDENYDAAVESDLDEDNLEVEAEKDESKKKRSRLSRESSTGVAEERAKKKSKVRDKEKKKKVVTEKTRKDRERKAFRKCEEDYCPLLDQWNSSLKSQNIAQLQSMLGNVLKEVEKFSPTFIETYDVSGILKRSKSVLKEAKADLAIHHEVREAFKKAYLEKKKEIPDNFKMRKSAQFSKQAPVEAPTYVKGNRDKVDRDPVSDRSRSVHVRSDEATPAEKEEVEVGKEASSDAGKPTVENKNTRVPRRDCSVSSLPSGNERKKVQSQTQASIPPVGERKKFSLTSLMGQGSQKDVTANEDLASRPIAGPHRPPPGAGNKKPLWMTEPWQGEKVLPHDQRMLALDFLSEMALFCPEEKWNQDSIARSIEAAVYYHVANLQKLCPGSERWLDPYWKKVHTIVATVSGKSKPGSLLQRLLSGRFRTASDLVKLSEEEFAQEFDRESNERKD